MEKSDSGEVTSPYFPGAATAEKSGRIGSTAALGAELPSIKTESSGKPGTANEPLIIGTIPYLMNFAISFTWF